ncbi:MAG: hypothetical protein JWM04_1492, partial [Verrucomicrobiales bacterium]|nr:hypothetical protein [Verrucomicrobiales bacterium]
MKHLILKLLALVFALTGSLVAAEPDASNPAAVTNSIPKVPFTVNDANIAFDAFNKAFYVVKDGKGYYKEDTTKGRNHFWTQAEEIEMIVDTVDRTQSPAHKTLLDESISGFVDKWGTNWTSNHYNDDLMWMVIATSRAFLATKNPSYKEMAKFNFNETYARAWSTNLGGGLWWSTTNASKNACINGPAAIAACYLYQILGDKSYLDKAKEAYAWERKNLFEESTGLIHDSMRADGQVRGGALTYNQGTFIGAANFLASLTGDKSYLA